MRLTKAPSFALSVAACLALLGQVPLASGEPASPSPAVDSAAPRTDCAASCEPPWFVDWRGIRRIRAGCLEPAATARAEGAATPGCAPPFYLDAQGIKRIKMACLDAMSEPAQVTTPADDCKQPFYLDAQGIRRLRMNCL